MKSKIIVSWVAVLLWMAVIFSLSAQPAVSSDQLSKGVTEIIVEIVEKITSIDLEVDDINHVVRKYAHFVAYLILGVLVLNALNISGSGSNLILLAGLICVGYAIGDEIHQMFVPGRGPQIKDVFIDSSGASVGIAIYQLTFIRTLNLRSKRHIVEFSWTDVAKDN